MIPYGRALVPGCGRGYDVIYLAHPNRVVIGLDIVDRAIDEATKMLLDSDCTCKENAVFLNKSFFDMPDDEKFDFIYDYTFFCALDPSLRSDWATKMASLIKQGGELCTIIYPICNKEGGPPFKVSLDDYKIVLEQVGFQMIQLEPLPSTMCHPGRDGTGPYEATTAIGRWRRL